MNSSSHILVAESPQMTVLNLVLGGTIFTEGGHFGGGGGDTVHYDSGSLSWRTKCSQAFPGSSFRLLAVKTGR